MSTNHFKFGSSDLSSATRGGFKVGVSGGADYGPTSTTGFWNGVTPPVGGYTIYIDKASQGPSIHVANNDTECINKLLKIGATGSTIENVLSWANGQSNIVVLSSELTIGDLPGGGVLSLVATSYYNSGNACAGTNSAAVTTVYPSNLNFNAGTTFWTNPELTQTWNPGMAGWTTFAGYPGITYYIELGMGDTRIINTFSC